MKELNGQQLGSFFAGGCAFLSVNKEQVNALNVFPVPDGDTGTNMGLTITSAVRDLAGNTTAAQVAYTVANGALMGARGNSGVILSQILRGFSQSIGTKEYVGNADFAAALHKGVDLAYRTVMKPVEGTILTVCRAMAIAAEAKSKETDDIIELLRYTISEGYVALANTPNQLAALKAAGVVDAGGQGLLYIFEGGLRAILGESLEMSPEDLAKMAAKPKFDLQAGGGNLVYGYCTEFFIYAKNANEEKIREYLSKKGDSLIVVAGDGFVKVHVHTSNPGEVLAYALTYGSLHDVKIDNMNDQHRESDLEKSPDMAVVAPTALAANAAPANLADLPLCGVVAVCSGDGLAGMFSDFGAAQVVSGGQSMNPSAEDIVTAIMATCAQEVVVLPNNSNIIMAAQQAAELVDRKVCVVPTKFIPQGLTAMLGYNPEAGAEENAAAMLEYCEEVKSGEITYAVRDSSADGKDIKEGDILGISGKEIVAVGKKIDEVVLATIATMMTPTDSIITLFYGEDTAEEAAQALADTVQQAYSDKEVEVQRGGQCLYYYLLSVE